MNAQQLKNSILQEAIEGRLVPQDLNDEPASVLLDKIRKEKAKLVKEKKITLSKPERACVIKEDGEFPLPQNWKWGMVNDICRVFGRIGFRGYTKDDLRFSPENAAISISPSNMVNGTMDFSNCTYISEEKYEESPEIKIQNGDILIVKTGSSYGKTSLVGNLPWKSTINPQIAVVKDVKVDRQYLVYFFQSPYAQSKFKEFVLGTSIPTFSQLNLISMQIPLPPLEEQKRIVAKIEELLPKVDEYGKAQESLDKLNEGLPERLKKSILQEAIEGRLVPQDPNDEPASVLLDKIRKEKARLVKEGKLKKKDLEETPISEDEIPFEIPENWEWVRHNDLFDISGGSQPPKSDFSLEEKEGYIRLYQIRDYGEKPSPVYIPISKASKITQKGDILLARYGGSLGKVFIAEDGAYNVAMAKVEYLFNKSLIDHDYLYYYYNCSLYQDLVKGNNRSAQGGFNKEDLGSLLFPLPPLAEQHRIVQKIKQLMNEIDKLKV